MLVCFLIPDLRQTSRISLDEHGNLIREACKVEQVTETVDSSVKNATSEVEKEYQNEVANNQEDQFERNVKVSERNDPCA